MKRRPQCGLILGLLMATAPQATALAPTLLSVDSVDRRPSATFTAPKAWSVAVSVASGPGRATDGSFFLENQRRSFHLERWEIATGTWSANSQLDPGNYWVMVYAEPDVEACPTTDGIREATCASGYSEVLPLVIPKPVTRFTTSAIAFPWSRSADVTLTASPLGERLPYRVCYRTTANAHRCQRGLLRGFAWDDGDDDTLTVRTAQLPRLTRFTWFVGDRAVATRKVRVR